MKKHALIWFLSSFALWGGLTGCKGDPDDKLTCEGPECVKSPCNNSPDIVRVEFDPKEGKVPFDVTFNVKAEDPDDICPDPSYQEKLTYFWDFDGDGYVDRKTNTGDKITFLYEKPGDYKVSVWVADANNNTSKKVSKFIRATRNLPPQITGFYALPAVASLVGGTASITFHWSARDPDGLLGTYELDYGDGVKTGLASTQGIESVAFTTAGDKTIRLKVFDAEGAAASAETFVVISIAINSSEFVQTVGASSAFAINDNGGNFYSTPYGKASYVYVADGEITLKALRYPMSAFATGSTGQPAELIGMADYASDYGYWNNVVTHGNVAVVSSNAGMLVYNVTADSTNICKNPWDTNCYPGTPTQPVAICGSSSYMDTPSPIFGTPYNIGDLQLLRPSATGEVWAVGTVIPQTGSFGGLYGFRIDQYANANGYVNPHYSVGYGGFQSASGNLTGMTAEQVDLVAVGDSVYDPVSKKAAVVLGKAKSPVPYIKIAAGTTGFSSGTIRVFRANQSNQHCWHHLTSVPPAFASSTVYHNHPAFLGKPTAFAVNGDYAYIGIQGLGFQVFNIGSAYATKTQLDRIPVLWELTRQGGWSYTPSAAAFATAHSRPVTGELKPVGTPGTRQAFIPYNSFVTSSGGYPDCIELDGTVNSAGSSIAAGTATLATNRKYFPGNRLAIKLSDGSEDTNNGLGYRVISDYSATQTVIEGTPYSAPATWQGTKLYGVTHAAMLPAYPGANPVLFTAGPTEALGRSGKCLNVVYSYGAVTQPVPVTFDTAPVLLTSIVDLARPGVFAFDISVPERPVQINNESPAMGGSLPNKIELNGNWAFMASGGKGPIDMLDISDPYHLKESWAYRRESISTFARQVPVPYDFVISDFEYVKTPANPEGVLMVANGAMGMSALYIDWALKLGQGKATQQCDAKYGDSPCMDAWVPGLQLRHDGAINNINIAENRYALVSQKRGGMLIYDISAAQYGGNPTFVSHVRTKDNPVSMRIVSNPAGERYLFIADTSGYYLTPFADPRNPTFTLQSKIGGYTGKYTCVDNIDEKNFICGDQGVFFSQSWSDNAGHPKNKLWLGYASAPRACVPYPAPQITIQFSRLQTDYLAGRLFFFAEVSENLITGEIITDANGDFVLDANGNGTACNWQHGGGQFSAYQKRPGIWKRLYKSDTGGRIRVFDIDGYEDKIAASATDPSIDLRNGPSQLGETNLTKIHASNQNPVYVNRLIPIGPYLFVAGGESGGWVLNMADPYNPAVIGRTSIALGDLTTTAINAWAFPKDRANPAAGYVYLALVADNEDKGGIQMLRFEGLLPP